MLDVTGFGICSLNSIPERTIVSNRLSGLFHKKIHSLWNRHLASATGFPACSTRKFTLCGTGILRQQQAFRPVPQENSLFVEQAGKPVHKRLIENGATS
ncbi:hypothetical protein QUA74_05005 [Microcoleus sp. LAD1_D3]|uniref:hypothetical protein n=1 Tax=Microcoleus sp. LAD1_D3 TaxID=2819365 RepID=UPI002FD6E71C